MARKQAERRTQSQWESIIAAQQQSGQTIKAYCANNEITVSSFYTWKNKLDPNSVHIDKATPKVSSEDWLPMTSPEPQSNKPSQWDVELDLPGGVTLRMKAN